MNTNNETNNNKSSIKNQIVVIFAYREMLEMVREIIMVGGSDLRDFLKKTLIKLTGSNLFKLVFFTGNDDLYNEVNKNNNNKDFIFNIKDEIIASKMMYDAVRASIIKEEVGYCMILDHKINLHVAELLRMNGCKVEDMWSSDELKKAIRSTIWEEKKKIVEIKTNGIKMSYKIEDTYCDNVNKLNLMSMAGEKWHVREIIGVSNRFQRITFQKMWFQIFNNLFDFTDKRVNFTVDNYWFVNDRLFDSTLRYDNLRDSVTKRLKSIGIMTRAITIRNQNQLKKYEESENIMKFNMLEGLNIQERYGKVGTVGIGTCGGLKVNVVMKESNIEELFEEEDFKKDVRRIEKEQEVMDMSRNNNNNEEDGIQKMAIERVNRMATSFRNKRETLKRAMDCIREQEVDFSKCNATREWLMYDDEKEKNIRNLVTKYRKMDGENVDLDKRAGRNEIIYEFVLWENNMEDDDEDSSEGECDGMEELVKDTREKLNVGTGDDSIMKMLINEEESDDEILDVCYEDDSED